MLRTSKYTSDLKFYVKKNLLVNEEHIYYYSHFSLLIAYVPETSQEFIYVKFVKETLLFLDK